VSRVDCGKLAKVNGALRARDARKVDQDPARLPPHKKPKVWKLTVEWTETRTMRREREFTSRAARDESRVRIERHLREEAAKQAEREKQHSYRLRWFNGPFAEYTDKEVTRLTAGPVFVEYYGDKEAP
jgi:hypothetical protein